MKQYITILFVARKPCAGNTVSASLGELRAIGFGQLVAPTMPFCTITKATGRYKVKPNIG